MSTLCFVDSIALSCKCNIWQCIFCFYCT